MDQKNEVERKKAWQAPKLEALPVEETLGGHVQPQPETFDHGGARGANFS